MRACCFILVSFFMAPAFVCSGQKSDLDRKLGRAQERLSAGKVDEAISIYQAIVHNFPNEATPRVHLAIALFKAKRYRETIAQCEAALRLQPGLPEANLFLGASYAELGEPARAVGPLEKVIAAQPGERNAHLMLAEALLALERYEEAARRFQGAATLLPGNPRTWYGLGRSYEALAARAPETDAKTYRDAADLAYSRLQDLPPSLQGYEVAALRYEKRSRYLDAANEWRNALKLSPENARLQTALAWALYRGRDHEAALPVLEGLLKQRPDSAELNFLYGGSLVNLEKPEEAIPFLERSLKSGSGFLPAHAALGQAYLRAGRPEQAIPHLKASLPTDEDGSRHYQLVRAYQLTGQDELANEALEQYRRFLESDAPKAAPKDH